MTDLLLLYGPELLHSKELLKCGGRDNYFRE